MNTLLKTAAVGVMTANLLAFSSLTQAAAPYSVKGATTVDTAEAKKLWDEGAIFIDSRKEDDWKDGHIPKSVHLDRGNPTTYTKKAIETRFKKDKAIVTYCYGKVCTRSSMMAADLVSLGYKNVYFYREGFPAWSFAGHPIRSQ